MPKKEIEITLALAKQYLNPHYNTQDKSGIPGQVAQEEGNFKAIVAVLAKKDQNVLKIWKVVEETRRKDKTL